jgi:hypothetical protein
MLPPRLDSDRVTPEEVAYEEAGHAVVAHTLRFHVLEISTVQDGDDAGVAGVAWPFDADQTEDLRQGGGTEETRRRAEEYFLVGLAGMAAKTRYLVDQHAIDFGAARELALTTSYEDMGRVEDCLRDMYGSRSRMRSVRDRLEAETHRLVRDEKLWPAIVRVAEATTSPRRLSREEFLAIASLDP